MGIFFFYNNRKPRKFQHRTIMYDSDEEARKERMEKRIRRMEAEVAREEGREVEFEDKPSRTDFGKEFVSQTKYLKRLGLLLFVVVAQLLHFDFLKFP